MARDEEVARHRSKKDTKRWCHGKTGIEHDPKCEPRPESYLEGWYELRCRSCGKVLDTYIPPFAGQADKRPDWLVTPHSFTIVLVGASEIDDTLEASVYEACDDALLHSKDGVVMLSFDREAKTREEAVKSALEDLQAAGCSGYEAPNED